MAESFQIQGLPNLSREEAGLLSRHFEAFTETTNKLVAAHQRLQEQVCSLMEELEIKNRELESVNHELARRIQEAEEVREFLDRVIDSMQSGLVVMDPVGAVTRINRAACLTLGWRSEMPREQGDLSELGNGKNLFRFTDSESRPRSGETRLRKRDGEPILVRYTAIPLSASGHLGGEGVGTLLVFEDLSTLRLLEEKARRADRLTALGELAAGVAHEMRNPLATMRGFLQLLPSEYEDPAFREECSTRLIREIDRLARLTDSLLELSRPVRAEDARTDLRELATEVLSEQVGSLHAEGIELLDQLKEVPPLRLDRDRIKQVLLNLIINARQAAQGSGHIEVRLETRKEVWGSSDEETQLVCLTVRDNGKGIESRHLESIFDPFFTTKDEGTGLGLALCHRIMEEHGGVIRVESVAGKGATFTLYFPVEPERDENQDG
jgi:PAS domain S-box-containing protein